NRYGPGNPLNQIAAFDLHLKRLFQGEGRAQLYLYRFGGPLPDQQVVLALDVLDYRLVQLVSRYTDRSRVYYSGKRDHRDICRSAPDIHDHIAIGFGNRQPCTDSGRHRLGNQIDLRRFCSIRSILDRTALYLSDFTGDADDDSG